MSGTLDPATATRLEKVAVDNGFDQEQPRDGLWLAFTSTQAPLRIWLTAEGESNLIAAFSMSNVASALEEGVSIQRSVPVGAAAARRVEGIPQLHHLIRRAFQLSRTLPDALLDTFRKATATLPRTTEVERLVVQRVGQEIFRDGLIEYWQGRCAVTGLAIPTLLRASHIKPWAACEADAERLDVYNGVLLSPNLDAAFDRGFITVQNDGEIRVSKQLMGSDRRALGVDAPLRIRGLSASHLQYLEYHRTNIFQAGPSRGPSTAATSFQRYIGIDYSGAETPRKGLTGIRVFVATSDSPPQEERLGGGHWSRRALAEWLIQQLLADSRTIVGIDHCFSFPKAYFEAHALALDWAAFLNDFCSHWPTDGDHVYVDFVRDGVEGNGAARQGNTRWRRLTEIRAGGAKSPFHFDVPGSVAKSTHAGLPWLRSIRQQLGDRVHFWPFDGWDIPEGRSVIVEVYPSLWRARFPLNDVGEHQQDAYAVTAFLRDSDSKGSLASLFGPTLTTAEREIAAFEGWILGVS